MNLDLKLLMDLPQNLRGILLDWEQLDEDLCQHYIRDLEWILQLVRYELAIDASEEVRRNFLDLISLAEEIEYKMGLQLEKELGW